MVSIVILVNVLLTTMALTVTTWTTVQSIALKKPMDVLMEFAVQMEEPAIMTWKMKDIGVTVHHHGFLNLIAEESIKHVLIILVKIMEHVNLMDIIIFATAYQVSFTELPT